MKGQKGAAADGDKRKTSGPGRNARTGGAGGGTPAGGRQTAHGTRSASHNPSAKAIGGSTVSRSGQGGQGGSTDGPSHGDTRSGTAGSSRRTVERVLIAVVVLGLLSSLAPLAARRAVEAANRNLVVVPELAEFARLGLDAAQLRAAGATAAVVDETTVGSLEANGLVTLEPVPAGTRLLASPAVAAWLHRTFPSWPLVRARPDALRARRVGFWRGDLDRVAHAGLTLAARAYDTPALADLRAKPLTAVWFAATLNSVPDGAAAWFATCRRAARCPSTCCPPGSGCAPATPATPATPCAPPLGVVEGPQQLGNVPASGLQALFAASGRQAVRVFDPPPAVYARNQPADTELQLLRAATDRNVRVLVMHPVPSVGAAANLAMLTATVRVLAAHGFPEGPPRPLPPLQVPGWARAGIALAVAAAVGLLALQLGAGAWAWPAAVAALAYPPLAAALAFPGLGAWTVARRRRGGMVETLLAAGLALAGALLVAGYLADQASMMEWDVFRGVKLALIVPPLLAAASCLVTGLWPDLGRLAATRVRTWHLAALLGVAAAAYLYVLRSGNAGAWAAPAAEIRLRNWLQIILEARPREKEFLVGWPALMLARFASERRAWGWFGALVVAGTVAAASVIDSFAHIRTALVISLERTAYGLILGLALGAIAYSAAWAISWYSSRYRCPIPSRVKH